MIKFFLVCKNIETARKFIIPSCFNTIALFCQDKARFLITVYFAFTANLNSVRLNQVTNYFLRRLLANARIVGCLCMAHLTTTQALTLY